MLNKLLCMLFLSVFCSGYVVAENISCPANTGGKIIKNLPTAYFPRSNTNVPKFNCGKDKTQDVIAKLGCPTRWYYKLYDYRYGPIMTVFEYDTYYYDASHSPFFARRLFFFDTHGISERNIAPDTLIEDPAQNDLFDCQTISPGSGHQESQRDLLDVELGKKVNYWKYTSTSPYPVLMLPELDVAMRDKINEELYATNYNILEIIQLNSKDKPPKVYDIKGMYQTQEENVRSRNRNNKSRRANINNRNNQNDRENTDNRDSTNSVDKEVERIVQQNIDKVVNKAFDKLFRK